jgi:hypothetical protein
MTTKNPVRPGQIMGPVDYAVVSFPGNKFNGKIAPELMRLEKNNIIRVIDLVFVSKDENGKVLITEIKNLGGDTGNAFSAFAETASEWFSLDDIEVIASVLPNNSSAGILLYENTWAVHFKEALVDSGAILIDQGRIPSEVIRSIEQKVITAGGV